MTSIREQPRTIGASLQIVIATCISRMACCIVDIRKQNLYRANEVDLKNTSLAFLINSIYHHKNPL